jgi:alpha-beta hydrolase superfamily lysophospholipase
MRSEEFSFLSSCETAQIEGVFWIPKGKVRAIVQIVHGMLEHMGRYEDFAAFLCTNGFVVCGHNQLGHGGSLIENTKGYFGETDRVAHLLMDVHAVRRRAQTRFPNVPYFLFGHSMGSFIARLYLTRYGRDVAGAVFSGTGGPNPAVRWVGMPLALTLWKRHGARYKSRYLEKIASEVFGRVHDGTGSPFSWISSDPREVLRYERDGKMHFIFTVSAFYTLFELMDGVGSLRWAQSLPKNMPVLLVSGQRDPVGANGKGVRAVYRLLREAGGWTCGCGC